MIGLESYDQWSKRSAAASLAHTLHELGVIDDEIYDQLITDIYERYGDEYDDGITWSDDDL